MSLMPSALSNPLNHKISFSVKAIARYSASADDNETVGCFLVFQEMGEPPS